MPPSNRATPVAAAAAATAAKTFTIHAYRRKPHTELMSDGNTRKEVPTTVEFKGDKIKFMSNEEGHIVGTTTSERLFNRLVNEIPEAYIEYAAGENVPEIPALNANDGPKGRPAGDFVLQKPNGAEIEYVVLDTMDDAALRAFAKQQGIEDEGVPAVLTGDTLRRAVYNQLGGQ